LFTAKLRLTISDDKFDLLMLKPEFKTRLTAQVSNLKGMLTPFKNFFFLNYSTENNTETKYNTEP